MRYEGLWIHGTPEQPMLRSTRFWMLALTLIALGASAPRLRAQEPTTGEVVVYLVRHSERAEDGTRNPPISALGQARSDALASLLRDAGITHIHSSDFLRTTQTAAPLAEALGLETQIYDPRTLEPFAASLRSNPGRHLVVGHSNTTDVMAALLGGDGGAPIDEMEYDRLYVVTIDPEGGATTVLLRFASDLEG